MDRESAKDFEKRLGNNLYTMWTRMSSGSYQPVPVRKVLIFRGDGQRGAGAGTKLESSFGPAAIGLEVLVMV